MIVEALPQQLDLQLMQCPLLRLLGGIFILTRTALYAKINLNWGLKQDKCHVIIYIIRIALSHGWCSTTRALFAVKNCHHKDQVAARVITPGVKVGAAILEVVPVEGRAKAADVIHFHISGHSVHQIQALAIMELREVVPHGMCMRTISRWGIMDGLLTEVCSCVYL